MTTIAEDTEALRQLVTDIEDALDEKHRAEFHKRLEEVPTDERDADGELYFAVLLRLAWCSGPHAATLAQRTYDLKERLFPLVPSVPVMRGQP